jgi:CheY-like chemotaxis protein
MSGNPVDIESPIDCPNRLLSHPARMNSDPNSPSKKVLLVDDETAVIHVTKRMLEIGGFTVTGATTGAEALNFFENQAWDIVITDRAMPGMDGEELARRIKERAPDMPILLITGFPDKVLDRDRFAAIIKKPFASAELRVQIMRALGGES